MEKANILVIDDEESLRGLIRQMLELEGFRVFESGTAEEGLSILSREDVHAVISDVRLPDANGIDLIPKIKAINSLCEIIVITAYGTIKDGVRSIQSGAFDYITKGDEDNRLISLVEKAVEKVNLKTKITQLEKRISEKYGFENVIACSDMMKDTVSFAKKIAETDAPVLLMGETGSGKEVFAQAIHSASPRKDEHFIAVNCSSFSKELLESEMFGYKAGAFTGAVRNKKGLFEEADKGTLLLDEIGELDVSLQAKLLRVLETNAFIKQGDTKTTNVDVRIIAATNRNIEEEVSKGSFRKDLYYRLSVVKLEIPSLRDRREDIVPLINSFIKYFSARLNKTVSEVEPEFIEKLRQYDFPGNIRELRNIVERAVIISEEGRLKASYLPREVIFSTPSRAGKEAGRTLDEFEKQHILDALSQAGGNKQKAAETLGIGLTTLYRKLQQYGL
ncbi:MAG: sigma-54-dependent Fis family transcriptional regulator [Ignavibacteria bacterium]|jgi:DNA-binding NtrC family response regulator|nr:sigma-54-dependent Fis family transcriptional regulator [Ignavibacteria bacterium]MCU7519819.1 sigma-54-dependent Fis family transcriptional regulator [Ignavibacteria bacterium]